VAPEAGVRPRRVLVIWNPNAGTKAGLPTNLAGEPELRAALDAAGIEAELFRSTTSDAARDRVAAALTEGWDVIAAAGGDGTAHAIARQLLGATGGALAAGGPARRSSGGGGRDEPEPAAGRDRPALGLLPLGSAMNLARAVAIPRDLGQAAAILASGPVRAIDVGIIGDGLFFEIVSIGLGAEALERAQSIDRRRHWGAILEFARLASRYRRTRLTLRLDDRVLHSRALGLAIANGPATGMNLALAPDARIDDGRLDVIVHEGVSPSGLVAHMLHALVARPRGTFRTERATRVRVETRRPLAIYADGTDAGMTPVELGVWPDALAIVAPPAAEVSSTPPNHP
jgi:diacylglycerol kinase (ATP)